VGLAARTTVDGHRHHAHPLACTAPDRSRLRSHEAPLPNSSGSARRRHYAKWRMDSR
jgi:hypothetical protein